ncbi:MAG: tRNA uridine-5-carboxymethylaminomethyl(34) synthesis GTPase MnmE, partial [Planctomycetia bacterium]|nr:tRNA uridine-5-carboxymethylaminomethyl(34) synthesis GTPase MnmE [Planctomycetia bacterium]
GAGAGAGAGAVVVWTKCDLPRHVDYRSAWPAAGIAVSSVRGDGINELREVASRRAAEHRRRGAGAVAATAVRCRESLRMAGESLGRARQLVASGGDELIAAEVRLALTEIGKVVGAVYTDDVLDRVFSRFCIGK